MRVETNSTVSFPTQCVVSDSSQKSIIGLDPHQDEITFSTAYQQYMSVSNTGNSASQARIDSLTEQLRQDTSFSEYKHRLFMDHPIGRELAKEIILADEGIQEQIAKNIWNTYNSIADKSYLPASWRDIDVKAMLLSSDELTSKEVFSGYYSVLLNKARTVGLSDTEKLLSADLESVSLSATSTFDQKLDRIFDKVREEFKACEMTFDEEKSYAFYLDTSVFRFSVSGGTDTENALIEKVLNTSNYTTDNFLAVLAAIYNHRQEDGSYNPWIVDNLACKDAVPIFGVTSVSVDYAQKMEQLYAAYDRCRMDNQLKSQYGFGIDDIEYRDGSVVGKTAEVQEIIDNSSDFMKKNGYAYIDLVKRYTGTPEFPDAIFTYENGKFQTTYQIFDDESDEGATNSSTLIAKVQQELDAQAAVLENGRAGILARRSSNRQSKTDILFQQLIQNESSTISNGKRFWRYTAGRELAKQVILSNGELLSQISEMMLKRFSGIEGKDDDLFLPMNYAGVDAKAILLGSNESAIDQVLINYDLVLGQKARTTKLTKMERYLRNCQ